MFETIKNLWQQWRCSHYQLVTRTWLSNDGGASVMRRTFCANCGKGLSAPTALPHETLLELLDKAKALPDGQRTEI